MDLFGHIPCAGPSLSSAVFWLSAKELSSVDGGKAPRWQDSTSLKDLRCFPLSAAPLPWRSNCDRQRRCSRPALRGERGKTLLRRHFSAEGCKNFLVNAGRRVHSPLSLEHGSQSLRVEGCLVSFLTLPSWIGQKRKHTVNAKTCAARVKL